MNYARTLSQEVSLQVAAAQASRAQWLADEDVDDDNEDTRRYTREELDAARRDSNPRICRTLPAFQATRVGT